MDENKLRIIVTINLSEHLWYDEEKILVVETYGGEIVRQYIAEKKLLNRKQRKLYQHYQEIFN